MMVTVARMQAGRGAREPNENQIRQEPVALVDNFEFYSKDHGKSLGCSRRLDLWFSN